jgi:hypothetical protein
MPLQIAVCEEELSELCEALTLARIERAEWSDRVFEELADVIVCLSQIELVLRHHPEYCITYLMGRRPLWDIIEDRAAAALRPPNADTSDLLLLYTIRLKIAVSRTRRYNDGRVIWCHPILTAIGELVSCLCVVEADLWVHRCRDGTGWDRVMSYRAAKLARLRDRLEEAREAAALAAEDQGVA